MKVLYFAWLRQKIGMSEESIDLPDHVSDVAGLLDWLSSRGPEFADALAHRQVIRVAVNQEHVTFDAPIKAGDEIALFPPVTGG